MKKQIILFSLFFSFLMLFVPLSNIVQASELVLVNWNSAIVPTWNATTDLISYHANPRSSNSMETQTYTVYSGTKSYMARSAMTTGVATEFGRSWINFSDYGFISFTRFYIKQMYVSHGTGNPAEDYFYIMNGTHTSNWLLRFGILWQYTSYLFEISDGTITKTIASTATGISDPSLYYFRIDLKYINTGTINVSVYYSGTSSYCFRYNMGTNGQAYNKITGIYYDWYKHIGSGNNWDTRLYTDDINISYGTSPTEEGGICDYGNYNYHGALAYNQQSNIQHNYSTGAYQSIIEARYQIKENTTVYGVELPIDSVQRSKNYDLFSSYMLSVNGNTFLYPTEVINFSSYSILRWCGTSKGIINNFINFQFYCVEGWEQVYISDIDLNGDGTRFFASSNNTDAFYYNNPFPYAEYYYQSELVYKFYCGNEIIGNENTGFRNLVITDKSYYNMCEKVKIDYWVNNSDVQNLLRFYLNGTLNSYYPDIILLDTHSGFYFKPFVSGTYLIKLMSDGVQKSSTFFIVNNTWYCDSNYFISDYPDPSERGANFNIYYRFFNNKFKDGIIGLSLTPNINSTNDFIYKVYIDYNTTGTLTWIDPMLSDVYYIKILENRTQTTYSDRATERHDIRVDTITSVTFIDKLYKQYVNSTVWQSFNVRFSSYGSEVRLLINGDKLKSWYGGSVNEEITKDYTIAKPYNVSLVKITKNGTVTMFTGWFYVYEGIDYPTPTNQMMNYIIGTIIVVVFLFIPALIDKLLLVTIPIFVYYFMGTLGTVLSTILGFYTYYIPASLMLILVLIIVIMWLQSKKF